MCFTALPFPHVERQLGGPWCISLRPVTAPPELGNANVPEKTTATWDQPPTEIKKSSWIISFPVQPGLVEISKDQPSENKHRLFIQRLLQRGSQLVTVGHLCFCRDSKAGRGVGKFPMVERKEGFRCVLIEGRWHREAGNRLTRNGTSCVTG